MVFVCEQPMGFLVNNKVWIKKNFWVPAEVLFLLNRLSHLFTAYTQTFTNPKPRHTQALTNLSSLLCLLITTPNKKV